MIFSFDCNHHIIRLRIQVKADIFLRKLVVQSFAEIFGNNPAGFITVINTGIVFVFIKDAEFQIKQTRCGFFDFFKFIRIFLDHFHNIGHIRRQVLRELTTNPPPVAVKKDKDGNNLHHNQRNKNQKHRSEKQCLWQKL